MFQKQSTFMSLEINKYKKCLVSLHSYMYDNGEIVASA